MTQHLACPPCSFKEAAPQLRFPYLDWASIDSLQYGLPDDICMAAEVTVINPVHGDPKDGNKVCTAHRKLYACEGTCSSPDYATACLRMES